jgi:beta-glucosidase
MRSFLALLALLPLAISPSLADVITGKPDAAPAGFEEWVSPVVVPAPNVAGHGDWADAVTRAKTMVKKMTLVEKVNVTTGQGLFGRCVGNTGVCLHHHFFFCSVRFAKRIML